MEKKYEIVVIFPPETKEKEAEASIASWLSKAKAGDVKTESWGKKPLSYLIKKQSEGLYSLTTFTATPKAVVDLQAKLALNEDLLRYLLVSKE